MKIIIAFSLIVFTTEFALVTSEQRSSKGSYSLSSENSLSKTFKKNILNKLDNLDEKIEQLEASEKTYFNNL